MLFRSRRRAFVALALCLTLGLVFLSQVFSFSEEEPLWFIDPEDGQSYFAEGVSSVHFDQVGALAECAGFNRPSATIIQIYSQLADSNTLADGKYSVCGRTLPTPPPSSQVCNGQDLLRSWPRPDAAQEGTGCFTSRFSAFAPFFHFARNTPAELGAIRAWAYGETQTLRGYAAYAWGNDALEPVINASCTYIMPVDIDTGDVQPGSPQAFGLYLHSLADHDWRQACLAQLDAAGEPWGTQTNDPRFPACATSAFLRDFGASNADTNRTEQAILAVYGALVERSQNREQETLYQPIPVNAHNSHLATAISEFVHTWPTLDQSGQQDYAGQRRQKAAEIKQWCAATRANDPTYARTRWFSFLPLIIDAIRTR